MFRKLPILVFAIAGSLPGLQAQEINSNDLRKAKSVAIDLVNCLLVRDAAKLRDIVHSTARWKSSEPGSAIEMLKAELERGESNNPSFETIREIIFFTMKDIPDLRLRFPRVKLWNDDRVPSQLAEGALGCLLVSPNPVEKHPDTIGLNVIVVKKIDNAFRVVYLDDLP